MELDFKTVKALSSPTRIRILDKVIGQESTPTSLSEDLGMSKSTISSHLDTLVDAELVEKDKEEGRRRVVYRSTSKSRAIVSGRERKVRFSLASSVVSGFAGLAFLGSQLPFLSSTSESFGYLDDSAGMEFAMEEAETAVEQDPGILESLFVDPEIGVLMVGVFFISLSFIGFAYGLMMNKFSN